MNFRFYFLTIILVVYFIYLRMHVNGENGNKKVHK